MKTRILILFCMLAAFTGRGQTVLLTQNFDSAIFPPIGWLGQNLTGPTAPGTWIRVINGVSPYQFPYAGLGEAKFNSFYYMTGTSGEIVTSAVDFTDGNLHTVKFWMYRDAGFGTDKLEVYVNSTQTSVGGTKIGTVNRNVSMSPVEAATGWYQYTFTVPGSYNTATNYISFVGISGFGFNLYIDEISIESSTPVVPSCLTTYYPADMATGVCPNTTITWDPVDFATGYKLTLGNNAPNYNNVANNLDIGNTFTYTVALTASSNYRWKIRPYNEQGTASCTPKSFTTASSPCYCTPDVFAESCETEDYINNFSTSGGFTNISNNGSGCTANPDNYTFYSEQTITANQGTSFNVSMQSGSLYEQGFSIWIDWNRDGDFGDADEYAFNSGTATLEVVNGTINVPATATPGVTRMRVRCTYNYVFAADEYCLGYNEGETEDYTVTVLICVPLSYYLDADGDGYGNTAVSITACGPTTGYVTDNTDCDDANSAIHPTADEMCNLIDDDCDFIVDEDVVFVTYYADADADGYGDISSTTSSCSGAPVGYVSNSSDCNDANTGINPGAVELCNSIDDNCNVTIDEGAATATITPSGPTTICKGTALVLSANTGVGFTYQWMRNGSNLAGATSANLNINKSGNYQVKVTVPGGCFATSTTVSCTVNSNPNATISTPDGLDLCGIDTVTLIANAGAGFTYTWTKNGTVLDAATSQILEAETTGSYRVTVTNVAGCSKTSAAKSVINSCRIGENNGLKPSMNLFPNPAEDILTVTAINFGNGESADIFIYDMLGNIVFKNIVAVDPSGLTVSIPVSELAAGIYTVVLRNAETTLNQRAVIH